MSKKNVGRGRGRAKKRRVGRWIFWSVLTALNLILSVLMRIADRKNAIAAIQKDEELAVLYTGKKTTKTL